jgi:hypothetical protein
MRGTAPSRNPSSGRIGRIFGLWKTFQAAAAGLLTAVENPFSRRSAAVSRIDGGL